MTRTRMAGLALLLAALLVAGCGGGGDGEPTVTQTLHDELQAELDAALAELAKEREAKTTAQGKATRLEGELETAAGNVARLTTEFATTQANVTQLTDQLEAAAGNVRSLTAQIGDADDADSLQGMLASEKAEVTRLEGVIGAATDAADADGSLHAQLNAATAEVTRLEGLIGAATDAADADGSLHGQLNAAKARVTSLETLIGDPITPAATSLRGQLAAANAKVTSASGLQTELNAAKAEVTRLKGELQTANTTVTSLRTQLATAQTAVATARQRVEEQIQQVQQQAQGQEANQRAQNLRKAFPGGAPGTNGMFPVISITATSSPVVITVPTSGRLTLKRGRQTATLSGTGLRSTTMTLPSGGDSGKAVIYTDRELSRKLEEHYGDLWDKTNARFNLNRDSGNTDAPTASPPTIGAGDISHAATTPPPKWRIAHNVLTSAAIPVESTEAEVEIKNTKRSPSYTGYLHGVSGRFFCSGGTDCRVQVAPNYATAEGTNNKHALLSVAVTSVELQSDGRYEAGDTTLHFKPGSSLLQLYNGGPGIVDTEYMVFGYWREDPTSAAADYKVGVFAQAFNDDTNATALDPLPSGTTTVTYDGTAVGMYVEQDPTNPVDTHRQGEFTADVDLTLSGTPVDATSSALTGTIDDFVTTPTGGSAAPRTADRWIVRLDAADGESGTARIDNLTGIKSGSWEHTFVRAHQYAADDVPPAVAGTFNARILDFVHLLGAFGAEKR